jgi:hypothetical protein
VPPIRVGGSPVLVAAGAALFLQSPGTPRTLLPVEDTVELAASSGDGRHVAWVETGEASKRLRVSLEPGKANDLMTYDPAAGDIHDLAWSPSGERLLITVGDSIQVLSTGEPAVKPLAKGTRPIWLTDDTVLYETGASPNDEEVGLVQLDLKGGKPALVVPWGYDASATDDGQTLAYVFPRMDDDPRLMLRQGGKSTRLGSSTRFDRMPVLSADGSLLVYVRANTETAVPTYSIQLLELTSGTERTLASGLSVMPSIGFGRDGSLICAALPATGDCQCFQLREPSATCEIEPLTYGELRPTLMLAAGAAASRR